MDVDEEEGVEVWEGAGGATGAGDVGGDAELGGGVRRLAKDGTVQGWSGNRVRDGGVEGMELGNGEVGCAVEEALSPRQVGEFPIV